ncbi:hypothetical protein F4604DRAFT_1941315 [Suillus subluteus]|nr:hypothetical protein F4604DRAFT_1941315 [Suillus subluteus]
MPVVRPSSRRRSARLRALQTPSRRGQKAMEQVQGPVTRGRGSKSRGIRNPAASTGLDHAKIQIQWLSAPSRTQKVIDHLQNNQADCRVLFYSDGKQLHSDGDRPSGKDKVSICAVIAKKIRDSTNNHINSLRKKYRECHDRLHATGAGIMPQDENTAQNLHAQILQEFPWYDDLVGIMGGNPALSLKTISSRPGVDHAADYFAISSAAGSSYSETLRSGSAQFGARPEPVSTNPGAQLPSAQPQPPSSGGQFYPPPSGGQFYPPPSGAQFYPPHSGGQPYPPSSGGQPYPPSSGAQLPSAQPQPPSSGGQFYPPPSGGQFYPPSSGAQPYPPSSGAQPFPPSSGAQPYPPSSGAQPFPPSSGAQPYPPSSGAQPFPPSSGAQPYPPSSGAQPFPPSSGAQPYPPPGHHYHGGQPAGNQFFDSPLDNDDDSDINMPDYLSPLNYDDGGMDFSFSDIPRPTPPPQHDYRNERNVTILDSPPNSRRAASKRPLPPSSPSPPITPPPAQSEFVLPRTSQASFRDSRASFGMSDLKDPKRRTSTGSLKPTSRRSSGSSQSKPASVSSAPMSTSTPMTSPANSSSTGKQKQAKKPRSDIQSRVELLNDEIENAQSDRITREELKNERYMAKYNLARQVNEHKYLKTERADDHAEAAAAHIRGLEAKNSEIRLREAETKMHDAVAHAHAEEAATLRLKIEYARLMGSNSGS